MFGLGLRFGVSFAAVFGSAGAVVATGSFMAAVVFAVFVTAFGVLPVMGLVAFVARRSCAGYVAAAALTVPVAAVVVVATAPDRDATVSVGKAADSMVVVVAAVPDRSVVSVGA